MKLNITSADLNVSNSTGEINGARISFNAQEDSEQSISGMVKLTKEEYGDGSLLVNRVKSKLIALIDSETVSLSAENMELINKVDQLTLVVDTMLSSSTSA